MIKEQTKIKRQLNFLLVYESSPKCDGTDENVKNQKDEQDIEISDLSEEEIKKTRRKFIKELREFGY